MNSGQFDDQWLDALLEQPPAIAEHGFVNSVRSQLTRLEKLRKQVFLGAAIAWTILLLLVLPTQFLMNSLKRVSEFGMETERMIQLLVELDFQTLAAQSGNLSTLAVFLLAIYAVISLQVRKW